MAKLTQKPKRPALARAKTALAATTMVLAVAGCGDDDGTADAGVAVGVTAPDTGMMPIGVMAPDGGVDAPAEDDAGEGATDAGDDVAPPPGLMAFDAG